MRAVEAVCRDGIADARPRRHGHDDGGRRRRRCSPVARRCCCSAAPAARPRGRGSWSSRSRRPPTGRCTSSSKGCDRERPCGLSCTRSTANRCPGRARRRCVRTSTVPSTSIVRPRGRAPTSASGRRRSSHRCSRLAPVSPPRLLGAKSGASRSRHAPWSPGRPSRRRPSRGASRRVRSRLDRSQSPGTVSAAALRRRRAQDGVRRPRLRWL